MSCSGGSKSNPPHQLEIPPPRLPPDHRAESEEEEEREREEEGEESAETPEIDLLLLFASNTA